MTRCALLIALAGLCSACSEAPAPAPDPVKLDRLLARMESGPEARLSPAAETKLRHADRLTGALARVEPKRIDPNLAIALIAR